MKRIFLTLGLVFISTLAWSLPTNLPVFSPLPEKIVPLSNLNPVAMRLVNCNVIGSFENPQVSTTCDRSLAPFTEPIVLREVQIHTAPYAEQAGQLFWGAQCWTRVQISEDGETFHEIAKFSWPVGDYHGINHVLPVPIGLNPSTNAVLRAIVGITSIEPDECRVEVKVYSTTR